MTEIITFINTFLGAPLQLVIILFAFGIFLYWYVKVRPKELSQYENLYNTVIKRCEISEKELKDERENFFKIMEDYRVQNERVSALYDKALENSTRAIENNTSVIHPLGRVPVDIQGLGLCRSRPRNGDLLRRRRALRGA